MQHENSDFKAGLHEVSGVITDTWRVLVKIIVSQRLACSAQSRVGGGKIKPIRVVRVACEDTKVLA